VTRTPSRHNRRTRTLHSGRLVAAAFVCIYVLVVAVGGRTTWERLRVPVEQPSFLDMRSLTSAWECERRGIDVLPVNPCDPRDRPANYPSVWLALAPLGLGDDDTVWLGVGLAVVFFLSALAVTGPLTLREGALYGIALCSPGVMFGVERGNPDLFIFAMIVASLLALERSRSLRVAGYALLVAATILKFFPGFAWGMVVRRSTAVAVGMAAIVVVYALLTFDEIRTILDVVPKEVVFSYGAGVLAEGVVEAADWSDRANAQAIVSVLLVLVGGALAVVFGTRWRLSFDVLGHDRKLDGFWAGAGIYVGSYAVMHNYDYRMAFLLLAIPQLSTWSSHARSPLPASLTLAALMTSLLLAARPVYDLAAEEVVNWALFVALGAGLFATVVPPRRHGRAVSGAL